MKNIKIYGHGKRTEGAENQQLTNMHHIVWSMSSLISLRSIVKATLILTLLLTLGVGQVWGANSSVKGAVICYYNGGSGDKEWEANSGSPLNLGTVTTLYLKGFKAYVGDDNVCENTCIYYGFDSGTSLGSYNISTPVSWSDSQKEFSNTTGIDRNILTSSGIMPGANILYLKIVAHGKYGDTGCAELTSPTYQIKFNYYPDLWVPGDDWGLGDWDKTTAGYKMSCNTTTGVYTKSVNNVAQSNHKFKLATYNGGQWLNYDYLDESSLSNVVSHSTDGDKNIIFQPAMDDQTVTITYTGSTHKISITCTAPLITFDKEGGDGGTSTQSTYYNETPSNISKPSKTGYTFGGYYTGDDGTDTQIINANGAWLSDKASYTNGSGKWIVRNNYTLHAKWTPNQYTITLNGNGGTGHTSSVKATYNAAALSTSITNPTKTGYNFDGWHKTNGTGQLIINTGGVLQAGTDYTGAEGVWTNAGNVTLFAGWTAKQCSITLDFQTGADGYYSSGNITNKDVLTATYDAAMTPLTGTMPTAAQGYAFMGYYDAADGAGTQYYTSTGASARTWNKDTESAITLYAYYKKAEITDITLNASSFVPKTTEETPTYVQATPTIVPTPVDPTVVCWELLYNNDNHVPGHDAIPVSDNTVKFTINGLAAGTYKIKATLHTGETCPSVGTLLSTQTTTFRIASSHTLDIQYICDNEVIGTGTVDIPALGTAEVTAPTHTTDVSSPFFGYSFHHWVLPDGVTCTSGNTGNANTKGDLSITISASYAGTIKVHYTHRGMVFFKKPSDWTGDYVFYYNIGSADKWKDSGDGDYGLCTTGISWGAHAMTRIGTSNIYYYDFEGTVTTADDAGAYIAFMDNNRDGHDRVNGARVSWPIEYTQGFNTGTPMFVCANYRYHQWLADYYNGGYWTKYHPDWSEDDYTGYTLKIYNQKGTGRKLLKSVPFTSTSEELSYSAVVELEAGQTYGFKFVRDNGIWFKNDNDGTMTYTSHSDWPFVYDGSDGNACGITTTATGNYTFVLTYNNSNHNLRMSVTYPIATNDYRLIYKDDIHTKWHPSATITKQNNHKDTVSFFVRKDKNPIVKIQKAAVNGTTGAVTWSDYTGTNLLASIPTVISSKSDYGVFNFNMQTNNSGAMSLQSIDEYTGDFYIRTDAANNKWDSYKAADHLMTYSEFSESDANVSGPKYSHYFCAWCPRGRNVKFTIANDYSPCISDTLIQDAGNPYNNIYQNDPNRPDGELKAESYDGSGNITSSESGDKYSANIRFMWNRKTNAISRAYVASSTNTTKRFLVLVCKDAYMHDKDNNTIPITANLEANAVLLEDDQNWIYETVVKVCPTARVRLYASYAQASPSPNGAQYFRGAYAATYTDASTIQLLGGSGSTYYLMRVIYDFKTNRLITAWLPDGTAIAGEPLNIDADIMVIRDHQQAAEAITFTNSSKSLGNVKTVYGTMKFNRWTLNNRKRGLGGVEDFDKDHCSTTAQISTYHPLLDEGEQLSSFERNTYFISFPFDVKLNEVFGFGTYGTHWIISKYNGLRRAQVGYFYDNCINGDADCTNWDYIWDRTDVTLNAYEGYLLSLDLDLMQYDDTTNFWLKQIQQVELYFPSSTIVSTIASTDVELPALGPEYECTKNYNFDGSNPEGDRRVKDSYWRCMGIPSYATYGTVLKDENDDDIYWQKNYRWEVNPNTLPFLYEWNTTDNTLTPQVTSTYTFKPMHSYLIQCKSSIKWTAVNATPSVMARELEDNETEYTWRLYLSGAKDDESDTYIRMIDNEDVTAEFDFGPDMIKKFRDGYLLDNNGDPIWDSSIDDYKQGVLHSDIYSMLGYEYLAANSMPINRETTTIIPIGVRLKEEGDYTISLPDGGQGVGITLVDNSNGERTNLSAGLPYTFHAEAGQIDTRFYVEISPIKQTTTGIEPGVNEHDAKIRKVMIDGLLYIVRDGKMFDATGKRVE